MKGLPKVRLAVVAALAVLALGVSLIQAQGPAVVIKDGVCSLFDANGSLFLTTESHTVQSNSANGNSRITCRATQPDTVPRPKKAVHWDYDNKGIACNTGLGVTHDWFAVVTPSGKAMLTCFMHPAAP